MREYSPALDHGTFPAPSLRPRGDEWRGKDFNDRNVSQRPYLKLLRHALLSSGSNPNRHNACQSELIDQKSNEYRIHGIMVQVHHFEIGPEERGHAASESQLRQATGL